MFSSPTAFRLRSPSAWEITNSTSTGLMIQTAVGLLKHKEKMPPHSQHPPLSNLLLLVFEAVLEVVCVSLPGYIIARQGMFDAGNQKFIANLNVSLFTPCLIFTKLASQLTVEKLADLAIIPAIFVVMTAVSYLGSIIVAKIFRFRRRARNFVIAMGVFGNSNSLPISLVLSLAFTLKGLHWDKVPGDNDEDVAARGILYLLIFQQLGQLVRWSWGYHVLLAPPSAYTVEEGGTQDEGDEENQRLLGNDAPYTDEPASLMPETDSIGSESEGELDISTGRLKRRQTDPFRRPGFPEYEGLGTPVRERGSFIGRPINSLSRQSTLRSYPDRLTASVPAPKTNGSNGSNLAKLDSVSEALEQVRADANKSAASGSHSASSSPRPETPENGTADRNSKVITSFPEPSSSSASSPTGSKTNLLNTVPEITHKVTHKVQKNIAQAKKKLPTPPTWLQKTGNWFKRFFMGLWEFMNPPLWAMLAAILVASVPALQRAFFTPGSFVESSVTRAVRQSGNVAVPLILVVLGANLAGNTQPQPDDDPNEPVNLKKATARHERNILIAALISRMLIPTLIIGPLLAITARYVPVSILDDPIFIIVCFLLTGAPSALQLSQICQLNNVYEAVMAKILFWSYVVIILPSTLILVICGLEVVEWADSA